MNFINETKLEAGWTLGFQPDGREFLVVAVKATYLIPENGKDPTLADVQVPLTEADEFTGEPGFSATLYETDYAHRKPLCDVLLNGSAYAPGGRPTDRVTVALRVGSMNKSFNVVGNRVWDRILLMLTPRYPTPFTKLPITYDRAFGGVDAAKDNPEKKKTYLKNPVGVGYYPLTMGKVLIGKPLPNTEEIGRPVKSTTGKFRPMAFGPIGRNVESRVRYAGTYDQNWLDHRAPFWPDDFDYRYFQSAPPDQQIPYPKGGEQVVIKNLSPRGTISFQLPKISMPILIVPYSSQEKQLHAVIDTVLMEPDHNRFMVTWRASLPLRRDCFELKKVVVDEIAQDYNEYAERCGTCGG